MLRRSKPEPEAAAPVVDEGGKGRPTPTRKEAETAAKERAKASRNPKAMARADRAKQASVRREAMSRGDERYLPKRDQGPVRRFIRDYVDVRVTFAELALPIIFIGLIAQGARIGGSTGGYIIQTFVLIVILEAIARGFLLSRQLKKRFPGQSRRGTQFYAFGRSLQLRFLRMPKPQVRIGDRLPETYK